MPACSAETRHSPTARDCGSRLSKRKSNRFAEFQSVAKSIRNLQEAIGLTSKESLIFKYLMVNPDKYVDPRQISALAFGLFDSEAGPAAVREHIGGIRRKYLDELGIDPIRSDPERGYMITTKGGLAANEAR